MVMAARVTLMQYVERVDPAMESETIHDHRLRALASAALAAAALERALPRAAMIAARAAARSALLALGATQRRPCAPELRLLQEVAALPASPGALRHAPAEQLPRDAITLVMGLLDRSPPKPATRPARSPSRGAARHLRRF
jgi:hypothetical protein